MDSDAGLERLAVGVEPQKGMAALGDMVWPLSHSAAVPQGQAAATVRSFATEGDYWEHFFFVGFRRDVQVRLLRPINSVVRVS